MRRSVRTVLLLLVAALSIAAASEQSSFQEDDDVDDDGLLDEGLEVGDDLSEAEKAEQADRCDAEASCKKRHLFAAVKFMAEQSKLQKKCELKSTQLFKKARKLFNNCVKSEEARCRKETAECHKKHEALKKMGNKGDVKVAMAPCPPCVFHCKMQARAISRCTIKAKYMPRRRCVRRCRSLCPAQRKCERKNAKAVALYKRRLANSEEYIRRCERRNKHATKMSQNYVKRCMARNQQLASKCARNQNHLVRKALRKNAFQPSNLPCPLLPCKAPKVKTMSCVIPMPKPPSVGNCGALCAAMSCDQRAKCEAANQRLLRVIATRENKYRTCLRHNRALRARWLAQEHRCAKRAVMHLARCQIKHANAVLRHHEKVKMCVLEAPMGGDWQSCNKMPFHGPVCKKFTCKSSAFVKHMEQHGMQNCHKIHAPRTHRRLRKCGNMCSKTYFAKYRGEKLFMQKLKKFQKSKSFHVYIMYRKEVKKCKDNVCRKGAYATFRRTIITCPVGPKGRLCRNHRKWTAWVTKRKVSLFYRFKKVIKACSKGKKGQFCRRDATKHFRRALRRCPRKGRFARKCRYAKWRRVRRILRGCAASKNSKVRNSPMCRRVQRRCVKRYTRVAKCKTPKCRKAAWRLMKRKCWIQH
mmetsp:Transcript_14694/g.23132  ORF Transcript_14694/g.23132 Transcript_14694/m.23132 type:complete len:640 (+) Transcript_14694:3-1922(+)